VIEVAGVAPAVAAGIIAILLSIKKEGRMIKESIERLAGMPGETLIQKQRKFAYMVGLLIQYAYDSGYEFSFGDAWSQPVYRTAEGKMPHMPNSLHYDRLAVDLNLFMNGTYMKNTKEYEPLGLFWESLGGSWGGRFNDGNHFSLAHNGRR